MIKKQTAIHFASQAYRNAMYYGKYDGKMMRGNCFYHVDFKNKVVDLGFSGNSLYFWSIPIRKSWI